MANSPTLGLTMMSASQAQKEVVFNEFLIAMDALFRGVVLSSTLNVPPGSPAEGDAYIVGPSPSGAWSGQALNIAFYFNGWQFVTAKNQMRLYDQGTTVWRVYHALTTSWDAEPASVVSVLNDLTNVQGTPSDGMVLTYVLADGQWEPKAITFPSLALTALSDVTATEGAGIDGQALAWNNTAGKWEPKSFLAATPTFMSLSGVTSPSGLANHWVAVYNASGPGLTFIDPTTIITVGSLSQIADVAYPAGGFSHITTGYVLKWNGAAWVPAAETGGGAAVLDDLTDVDVTTALQGQVLTYDHSLGKWTNVDPAAVPTTLHALTDVNVTEGAGIDGYVLKWSNATSKWIASASGGGGGSGTLAGDTDVAISSPTNGQALVFNASTSKWVNGTVSGGSGGSTSWTALTFAGTPITSFGPGGSPWTYFTSDQWFTLAAGDIIEVEAIVHRTPGSTGSADGEIVLSYDGAHGVSVAAQNDGNFVAYSYNTSSQARGAPGAASENNYTGFYTLKLALDANSNSRFWGSVNGWQSSNVQSGGLNFVSSSVKVYIRTDDLTKCIVRARVIKASTLSTMFTEGGGASSIATLTDVAETSPANAQHLEYDAGTSKWKNVATRYDLALSISGTMTASEVVLQYVAPVAFAIPAGGTGSYAKAANSATASTTVTIKLNGSSVGTIVWAASSATGAFTIGSPIVLAAGDALQLVAPATPDTTLADIGITLAGVRT